MAVIDRHSCKVVTIGNRYLHPPLFEQPSSHHSSFTEAYRTFAELADLGKLDLDPDQLFSGVRADTQGRR